MTLRRTLLAAALLQSSEAVRRTRSDEDINRVVTDATDANHSEVDFAENCEDTDLSPLAQRIVDLKLVGDGANGCVFIGKSVQHGNAKVAVKTSKKAGRLNVWTEECRLMQMLHTTACAKSAEQLDLVENYIPTCIEISGTDDNPFLIMHAAGTTQIQDYTEIVKTDEDKKSVFVQLVAAIYSLHSMGLTHNDLHAKNVMLEETTGDASNHIHLALIDFGDVMPPKKRPKEGAFWTTGYKRDSFAIWRMGGNLADCEGAEQLGATHQTLPAEVFEKCIKEKWNPGEDFMAVLKTLIQDTQAAAPNQHVGELYQTEFVQKHLPALKQYYQLLERDSCTGPGVLETAKPYNGTGNETGTDTGSHTEGPNNGDELPISTIEERQECAELCKWCPKEDKNMYACHSGNAVKQCAAAKDRWLSADCSGLCLCRETAEASTTTTTTTTPGSGARKLATLPALLLACLAIFRRDCRGC
eukprot:TRINITY_DN1914_c0_g2_i1.p1 TRINITY_DN1914_c0_g2~~TRINITY_DN1914_c0_g2_i1.p1  ORF type:complete len:471 (+),score=99.92 TRINITY_DN1914_c0_g2_i1:357-1769(+)